MSYAISRSTRDRKLFVLVSGDKESEMEFPFKEGAKHRANASRFTRWVPRNTTTKPKPKPQPSQTSISMDLPLLPINTYNIDEYDDDIPF